MRKGKESYYNFKNQQIQRRNKECMKRTVFKLLIVTENSHTLLFRDRAWPKRSTGHKHSKAIHIPKNLAFNACNNYSNCMCSPATFVINQNPASSCWSMMSEIRHNPHQHFACQKDQICNTVCFLYWKLGNQCIVLSK